MSETVTPAVRTRNQVSTTRFVGFVAIAYAASMIVQNALFAVTGAPDYSAPLGAGLTYHAENQGALTVTAGLEAVNMVLLLLFVTALHGLVQRRGVAGTDWSRLAVAAGATLSALFAFCHSYRGDTRCKWSDRVEPRLRADVAATRSGLCASTTRAWSNLHRRCNGYSR